MNSFLFSPSTRVRQTPFSDRVEALSVKGYSSYNHMLLASVVKFLEEDYRHTRQDLKMGDLSCQRQIEVSGRHALRNINDVGVSKKIMGITFSGLPRP